MVIVVGRGGRGVGIHRTPSSNRLCNCVGTNSKKALFCVLIACPQRLADVP